MFLYTKAYYCFIFLLTYFASIILEACATSVTLYNKKSFQGTQFSIEVESCIPNIRFNLLSIKVHNGGCVAVYRLKNCQGEYFVIKPGTPLTDDIMKYMYWHERPSSFTTCDDICDLEEKHNSAMTVDLFTLRSQLGAKTTVEIFPNKCTKVPHAVQGKVSSIRRSVANSCVELYEFENCSGQSTRQRDVSLINNQLSMEVFDDKAMSLGFCKQICQISNDNGFESVTKSSTSMPTVTRKLTTTPMVITTEEFTTLLTTLPKSAVTSTTTEIYLAPSETTEEELESRTELFGTTTISNKFMRMRSTETPKPDSDFEITTEASKILPSTAKSETEKETTVKHVFPPNSNADTKSSDGMSTTQIMIFALLGLLALLIVSLLVIVLVLVVHRRGSKQNVSSIKRAKPTDVSKSSNALPMKDVQEFINGSNTLRSLAEVTNDTYAQIVSQPYNTSYEISKENVEIDYHGILGFGQFAIVYRGQIHDKEEGDCVVAVKTIKPDSGPEYIKALLNEIKIMIYVDSHPFIVKLISCFTENVSKGELFIITELLENGSLKGFFQKNRDSFVDVVNRSILSKSKSNIYEYEGSPTTRPLKKHIPKKLELEPVSTWHFNTLHLIEWCRQIANGMEYLAEKKVIHGDLAIRNILLDFDFNAKISDFGLSRQMLHYSDYIKQNREPLPWRWLSIEALKKLTFSTESDVWSFGVTAWEIFSLGDIPYPGHTWDQTFVLSLSRGLRLPKPTFAPDECYTMMFSCWMETPSHRIPFREIGENLEEIHANLKTAL